METPSPTRRQVLSMVAATVSLPMVQAALNRMSIASAAASSRPSIGTAPASQPAVWFTTTLKAVEVKDNEFTAVDGHPVMISRSGKTICALTTKCTHQGGVLKPEAGAKIVICPRHKAQFNLDGSVAKAPARDPLAHFAIRVNDAGLIEINPGQKPLKDDKFFSITLA